MRFTNEDTFVFLGHNDNECLLHLTLDCELFQLYKDEKSVELSMIFLTCAYKLFS